MLARRKLVRQALRGEVHPQPGRAATPNNEGLFALLGDDAILHVLECLAALDDTLNGEEWQEQRRDSTRAAAFFARTCWRARNVLVGDITREGSLHAELLARGVTDAVPRLVRGHARPYLEQLRKEERSQHQLRAMVHLDEELGFHCAGSCCAPAREEANRRLLKHKSGQLEVTAMGKRVLELSPVASHADLAYAYDREQGLVKLQGAHTPHAVHKLADPLHGKEPLLMRASPDGKHLAFTLFNMDDATFEERTDLYIWTPEHCRICGPVQVGYSLEEAGTPLGTEPRWHMPTAVWWTSDNQLRVAWTTVYVLPCGADGREGQYPDEADCYCFGTYAVDTRLGDVTLLDAHQPDVHRERLVAVSPDASGLRFACLVRVRPHRVLPGEPRRTHYKVVVYSDDGGSHEELRHPQVWGGADAQGKDGFGWGPSAVGMSPAGDCLVVVHRTAGACLTEIFDHVCGARYARVNAHNITEWMSMPTSNDKRTGSNAIKLRYHVNFSACGRFAHVLDARAYHRYYFHGHAAAVLDLSRRRQCSDIPVRGLCHYEPADFEFADDVGLSRRVLTPTPIRQLHWGHEAVWALAARGALTITGP